MNNHTQLLNHLATTHGLERYLEIGVQNPANNFDLIKCPNKMGVDPEIKNEFRSGLDGESRILYGVESDSFFQNVSNKSVPGFYPYFVWDLIFIDGLHEYDQVKRDFENSLEFLRENGFIVIHDVMPANEPGTRVPRETKQWWGDVFKLVFQLPGYKGIDFCTFPFDHGCCLVWKDPSKEPSLVPALEDITFDFYLAHPDRMRVMDEDQIREWMD